jgi:RNA polymerase-associated protein CTR9
MTRAEKYLKRALEYYSRVLQRNSSNIYAASGIGCVLAEQGKLEAAQKIFTQVCCTGFAGYSILCCW